MKKAPLTSKKFDLEIEAIRALIQTSAKPFREDAKAQKERIAKAGKDLEFFGRTYFPWKSMVAMPNWKFPVWEGVMGLSG